LDHLAPTLPKLVSAALMEIVVISCLPAFVLACRREYSVSKSACLPHGEDRAGMNR
jgi:hypothetical protein